MNNFKRTSIILSLFTGIFLCCIALLAFPPQSALAMGGPALNVSGGDIAEVNGAYTDNNIEQANGKAFYWGPGGGPYIDYAGGQWELLYSYQIRYRSSSTNSSNAALPPTGGWVRADGSSDADFVVSYGPSMGFASSSATAYEVDGSISLRVNISNFSYTSMLYYTCSDGTAISGSDYSGGGSLQLYGSETFVNIPISIINDSDYEGNETFTVTLSGQAGAPITGATCTVTIVSDDPQAYVSVASGTITAAENSGAVSIPISLSTAVSSDVSVQYVTANGTAAAGSDYTETSGTLTIPAGQTTGSISVPVSNDSVYEGSETFTLTLYSPANASLGSAITTVNLTDDESQPVLTFEPTAVTVGEDGTKATLYVSLSATCQSTVTVQYSTADGSATSGSDYTVKTGTLTIGAGDTTGTFDVAVLDDTVYEGDEAFTVTLVSPTVAALGASKTATITLTDNDAMPQIAFASGSLTVNEDAGTAGLVVTLIGQSQLDTTVQYTTQDGTALAGSDYTAKSETFTIPGGTDSGTIQIPITDDNVFEGAEEAFTVTLSSPVHATLGANSFMVTITDNETLPQIAFTSGTFTNAENGSSAEFHVSLTCASQTEITVAYTTQDGTAVAGSDYTSSPGTLTINPYNTSGTIQIPLINDNLYEGDETFTASLSSPAGATLGTSSATMTIADDEPIPQIGFTPAAVTVHENDANARLTVALSGLSKTDCTVDYTTVDGTAKAYSDYTITSGKLTIPAGSSSITVDIPLVDNSIYEGSEAFTVTLYTPSGAVLGAETATVSIEDNEAVPRLSFDPATLTVDESAAAATLTVTLSGETQEDVTVTYSTADATATDGSDYTAKTGTLTIPAGSASGTVQVALKEDSLYEGGEEFTVGLSTPSGAVLGTVTATVSIIDNETMPVIAFDPAVITKNENSVKATLTVSLSGKSQADVTVQYATQDGTAISGSDYTAASGTLTIPGGDTSATVDIGLMDDSIYEGSEAFAVLLSAPAGATLGADTATVSLNDTESMPVLNFDPNTLTLAENEAKATLTVTLSGVSQADTTVQYITQDGTAKAGNDFTAAAGTLIVPAGSTSATLDIPLLDDSLYEGNESFTVQLSDPAGAALGTKTATVTLTDSETKPNVGFDSAAFAQIENGGKASLTVALSGASQADVRVGYVTAGGTAKADIDYTGSSGTLVIPGGSTSGLIEITLNDDILYEGDEAFRVTLSAPSGATLGTDEATVTIRDNESMPAIGFTQDSFEKEESTGKVSLTVSLTCASQTDIRADYSTSDLTAAAGSDYTAKTGTLLIPAGEIAGKIEITLKEDSVYEGSENFDVTLSDPIGATLAMHSARVEITDNESVPQISLDPAALTLDEGAGKASLSVKLSGQSQADTTVQYATLDSAAKAGFDFTAASGTLTIPAGSTAGTIEIALMDDVLYEAQEDFTVALLNPTGAVPGLSSATVSITDNDTMPSVGFEAPLIHVGESEAQALITVRLDAVSGVDTSVSYTTLNDTALSGTDYTAQTGTLVIPAGSLTGTVPIPLIPDAVYEESEAFTAKLSAPSGAALSMDTVSVVLDDSMTVPALSIAPVTVRESIGEATLTVALSHLSSKDITVAYVTSDKTAKAGSDYRSASGTLVIPAMTQTGAIKVRILNDAVYETTETLKIALLSPTGATIETDQALITITDNDPKPTATPTASPTPTPSPSPAPTATIASTATRAQATATPTAVPATTFTPAPTPSPTLAPVMTINPGTLFVDVQEEAMATQEKIDDGNGRQETATVVNVDEDLFERTVAYAREVAQDTGADVIVRFPDIVPQEEDTTMRLNLLSNQVLSVADEGMGVSVKMENVTFAVPSSVLSQATEDTDNISLECRKAQDEAQPYFKIDCGSGTFIGQAYQYALAVTRKNGDTGYVDQFNSPVTITVQLTPEEAAAITDVSKAAMRYVNPATGRTELLPSVYDPIAMTLTFNTTYFAEAAEE